MRDRHRERLARMGDRIEVAVARQVQARSGRPSRAALGLVAATVAVAGALAAVAVLGETASPPSGVVVAEAGPGEDPGPARPASEPPAPPLTEEVVAQGMVDGSLLFAGTDPSCTTRDGVAFACVLDRRPAGEVVHDLTGVLFTFVDDDLLVAGACRGGDRAGWTWTCLAGEAAVEAGYVSAELLGQFQPVPGQG